jgi:hypothetical protein
MNRAACPFNEERKKTARVVVESEGFPLESLPIGTCSGAGHRTFSGNAGLFEFGRIVGDAAREVCRPADQLRLGQISQRFRAPVPGARLLRVGRDDFQVVAGAERQEGVFCATARVDSAECGADSGVLFDEGHAFFKVAAAEQQVVEHRRHLVDERGVGFLPSLQEQSRRSK